MTIREFLPRQEHQKGVGAGRSPAEAEGPGGPAELQGRLLDHRSGREAEP